MASRTGVARAATLVCAALALVALMLAALPGDALSGNAVLLTVAAVAGAATAVLAALNDKLLRRDIAVLTDAAQRDSLTGLLGRRGFDERLDAELERARRTGSPLSVVVGNLDRFTRVNDAHGQAGGDVVLRRAAEILAAGKRRFDGSARLGADDFAVVAADCDDAGAYVLAERLRGAIEESFGAAPPVTISFGVASYPVHGQAANGLLSAADQALDAAKQLGRNRTVVSNGREPV